MSDPVARATEAAHHPAPPSAMPASAAEVAVLGPVTLPTGPQLGRGNGPARVAQVQRGAVATPELRPGGQRDGAEYSDLCGRGGHGTGGGRVVGGFGRPRDRIGHANILLLPYADQAD